MQLSVFCDLNLYGLWCDYQCSGGVGDIVEVQYISISVSFKHVLFSLYQISSVIIRT